MSRIILLAATVIALFVLVRGGVARLRRRIATTGDSFARSTTGDALMQKTSFLFLVALILYVSFWGGA